MIFFRKIKTRIALSFSLLFVIVTVPAMIYALHQVQLYFDGLYLEQMRTAALVASAIYEEGSPAGDDSLTVRLSSISSAAVVLFSIDGEILSSHSDVQLDNGIKSLLMPLPYEDMPGNEKKTLHAFDKIGSHRFLRVQTTMNDGRRLLLIKPLGSTVILKKRFREVIIWAGFLVLVSMIAVAFSVSANITRPLEKLTDFARDFYSGKTREMPRIKSPDEIGQLAEALNGMINDLQKLKQNVSRLGMIRTDFFANVTAELHERLLRIKENIENARNMTADNIGVEKQLKRALWEIRYLYRMINSLLKISRIEARDEVFEFKEFNIIDLVHGVARKWKRRALKKNISLSLEIPQGLDRMLVYGDEKHIEIVLDNLVDNAIRFAESGVVMIRMKDERESVRLTIEDQGCGIPAEKLDRIFERFYRIDSAPISGTRGAGLGLALAKHIIDAHNQNISVKSKLGLGSSFSFSLKKIQSA